MRISRMGNYGLILLKTGGMVLFFLLSDYLLHFFWGSRLEFFINNFWLFVLMGVFPACIACIKGHSFWIWWIWGTFFPILSTFYAIDIDDLNETSEKIKKNEKDQESVEKNDIDPQIK